jgi:hypothetical protein
MSWLLLADSSDLSFEAEGRLMAEPDCLLLCCERWD